MKPMIRFLSRAAKNTPPLAASNSWLPARTSRGTRIGWLTAATLLGCANWWFARAQQVTQTLTLQPGWNAVYLEVQPDNNTTTAVFARLPAASVWSRAERISSVDFIQNASEETFNEAGWLRWFHPSRPEAILNNLFAVFPNRAYLIRSTNATPVVWSLTGRPALRQAAWVPDAYNLRGLPVSPATPPTFLNFFRHSPSHFNAASGQLEKIYRLNASGQWAQVAANDATRSGEAYWIFTRGASDYLAPLHVQVDLGDGLDFGPGLTVLNLWLANRTAGPLSALVRDLAAPDSILSHYVFDPQLGGQWPALPNPLAKSLTAGETARCRLGARRQDLTEQQYQSVIEVTDGAGVRLLVPVLVDKPAVAAAGNNRGGAVAVVLQENPLAGLWVGAATLNAVSEAHSGVPTNPTPTKSVLNLRLLIHVDAGGQARLLKEVLQMWRNGTFTNDASGNRVVSQPGRYVLLTDDSLISQFQGVGVRDGESVGRRLATIGYDFPSNPTNNFLALSGTFAIGQSLTGTLTLPYDHPTNPFKHKYHPDHDNLNARFDGPAVEAYTTSREIRLNFAASPPDGPAVPDFGHNEMGGLYREIMTGIHKRPLHVSGTFRLTRVSQIAELNPSPTL
ncbi:MAG TPA: hypothetical protein VJA21_29620 [Verrucomicrobiae bacterium]